MSGRAAGTGTEIVTEAELCAWLSCPEPLERVAGSMTAALAAPSSPTALEVAGQRYRRWRAGDRVLSGVVAVLADRELQVVRAIPAAMRGLGAEERAVLRLRHGLGLGWRQCAAVLGVAEAEARELEREAMRRLRAEVERIAVRAGRLAGAAWAVGKT